MKIQPTCKCGTKFAPINAGKWATTVCDRTCRSCGAQWRVVARPVRGTLPGAVIHVIDSYCTKSAEISA